MILYMTGRPTVKGIQTLLINKKTIIVSCVELPIMEGLGQMNKQTLSKLHEMKLSGMAEAYMEQASKRDFQKLDFDERLSLIVDLEHSRRKSNKLQRLIQAASFLDTNACIEDIEYHAEIE
jgi:hypothetical protein